MFFSLFLYFQGLLSYQSNLFLMAIFQMYELNLVQVMIINSSTEEGAGFSFYFLGLKIVRRNKKFRM